MDASKPVNREDEGQISLKDIINKMQEWWRYLLSKWLLIILVALVGAALGLVASLMKKPRYEGELTFILEDAKSGGLGQYASIASQFGINLGGSGGGMGVLSDDNILEFLKSRLIVEKALLSTMQTSKGEKTLADVYIEVNEIKTQPKGQPNQPPVSFPVKQARSTFTRAQDSVLNMIWMRISKSELEVDKASKKSGFIMADFQSGNEVLAKLFVERVVDEATQFYIATKTKRSKVNVDALQKKADSLIALLNQKTMAVAEAQDANLNPIRKVLNVRSELASRDKTVLQTIYSEVVKNLELAKITMAQETPIIQIIDAPVYPLKLVRLGKMKGMIIGGFLGGFLICFFLLVRKTIREIVS